MNTNTSIQRNQEIPDVISAMYDHPPYSLSLQVALEKRMESIRLALEECERWRKTKAGCVSLLRDSPEFSDVKK